MVHVHLGQWWTGDPGGDAVCPDVQRAAPGGEGISLRGRNPRSARSSGGRAFDEAPGTVVGSGRVSSIDLFPTLVEAAGSPIAPSAMVVSLSCQAVLEAGQTARTGARCALLALPALCQSGVKAGRSDPIAGDYKLIEFYETGRRELFDLKQGSVRIPQPIAADKPEVVKDLAAKPGEPGGKAVGARICRHRIRTTSPTLPRRMGRSPCTRGRQRSSTG
jgi:hypothetical protein